MTYPISRPLPPGAGMATMEPQPPGNEDLAGEWADEEARVEALDEQAAWDCGSGSCDPNTGCPACAEPPAGGWMRAR